MYRVLLFWIIPVFHLNEAVPMMGNAWIVDGDRAGIDGEHTQLLISLCSRHDHFKIVRTLLVMLVSSSHCCVHFLIFAPAHNSTDYEYCMTIDVVSKDA